MLKNSSKVKNVVRKLRYRSVEFNIEPLIRMLNNIKMLDLHDQPESTLIDISRSLLARAENGVPENELLVEAYALIREASWRILKLEPFDVQVMAGIAMHHGGLVEMQTGEGKTLAAVFPAYLNALSGKGVHILTFNDYLAKRDALWMGPVFQFLGLSVGFIQEGMTVEQRKKAYSCDITYLTAKEAGFDYLREFLCTDKKECVHRSFNYAIIDEADSILIDEARIPLVIAGKVEKHGTDPEHMAGIIRRLRIHEHYDTDEYERNVYLTDEGISQVEEMLGCGNLYDEKNLELLVGVNNALHASVLLKRDIDYIVRNEKIQLVDEFTGRVADRRNWPHGLQEAIEAKEGIKSDARGQILASVTLQNFIGMYSKLCGMTGTALTAADELREFYGLTVVVIPTGKPCKRVDHNDVLFTHKEAKYNALISEIIRVHSTGRPMLIGTCSVEESEYLAERLGKSGVGCEVLNAKNDEREARIIANAGAIGAVTVSTNMAGRGTDIKLGGENETEREKVVALGGLYVVSTNRHESRRVDNQLRGRAGRQGDPGSSRFFISLEDDLLKRYRIKELIPTGLYPEKQEEPLANPVIKREVEAAQRIIEGQNLDIRRTLTKYSVVIERQRQIIHKWRNDILFDYTLPGLVREALGERYNILCAQFGEIVLRKAEKQVLLYFITKCWSDYLDYMSYVRESIHLVNMADKIPVSEFNKIAIESFPRLLDDVRDEAAAVLSRAEITWEGIDMEKEGLKVPSSTWTYLVDDRPEQMGIMPMSISFSGAIFSAPLLIGTMIYKRFLKKSGNTMLK